MKLSWCKVTWKRSVCLLKGEGVWCTLHTFLQFSWVQFSLHGVEVNREYYYVEKNIMKWCINFLPSLLAAQATFLDVYDHFLWLLHIMYLYFLYDFNHNLAQRVFNKCCWSLVFYRKCLLERATIEIEL